MIFKFKCFFQTGLLLFNINLLGIGQLKQCGIICLTKTLQDFVECYDEQAAHELGIKEINVFCDRTIGFSMDAYQNVFLHTVGKFQNVIKDYKYIIIVRPDFFKPESLQAEQGNINLLGRGLNIFYIGSESGLSSDEIGLNGNIYFANLRKICFIQRFDLLTRLIYSTIYEVPTLDAYLRGKGIANMYSLEIVLQNYVFYNRIESNVVRSRPAFPFIVDLE